MLLPVIMAGGTGSRLWPISRELYPKQFLHFYGIDSMLQETIKRLEGISARELIIICNEQHRFLAAEQLRKINKFSHSIILEPVGRNTAPAIALAALKCISQGDDPIMLVLAADHIINNHDAFHQAINRAIPFAHAGNLVTFGVVPTGPETGYGYIQRGKKTVKQMSEAFQVQCFVEKPNLKTAEKYVNSGKYYWNSGIFMFRAKQYIQELDRFRPDILNVCKTVISDARLDNDFLTINKEQFSACPDESIDYAVMEKTNKAVVVPLDAGWSDVGSWSALWDISTKDTSGNAITGNIFLHNVHNCYINADEKLIAAIGVDNLVIVSTKDAVLVVDKSKVQDVKKIVKHLKK